MVRRDCDQAMLSEFASRPCSPVAHVSGENTMPQGYPAKFTQRVPGVILHHLTADMRTRFVCVGVRQNIWRRLSLSAALGWFRTALVHRRGTAIIQLDSPEMPRSSKLDRAKIDASLNTDCPHCGHSITPAERTHIDTEHLECPCCHKRFIPGGSSS